jgi:hypothetical protein
MKCTNKPSLRLVRALACITPLVLCLPAVKADTVTDTSLNVNYTATSSFVAGPGNVYDVFLTIDPTSFSAGTGFLTDFSLQFKTGSDTSTSVSILSAPGGAADWGTEAGGLDASGCNGKGANSGDVCVKDLGSANATVPGGPYSFELAVTMPGTDALTAASDIKAGYNSTEIPSKTQNLGLTSMAITIQPSTVPEPRTTVLLVIGGLLMAFAARRVKSVTQ